MEAHSETRHQDYQDALYSAWHVAVLIRRDKLPSLTQLLGFESPGRNLSRRIRMHFAALPQSKNHGGK